jgi:hypothetical protein
MKYITMNPFLRGALAVDAIASGAMGIGLSAAPGLLAGLFSLPAALLVYVGMFLIVYAAFVAWLALRQRPASTLVWLVIIGNGIWVIASLALIASGWVAPSVLGYAFVIVQALAVGVFAELQFVGVRRAGPSVATA